MKRPALATGAAFILIAILLAVMIRPAGGAGFDPPMPRLGQATPCADAVCSAASESLVRVFVFFHNNSSASLQLAGSEIFDNNYLTEAVPTTIAPKSNAEFANLSLKDHAPVGGHVHYNVSGGGKLNIDYASGFVRTASVTPEGGNANDPYCSITMGEVSVGGAAITITFSDDSSGIFDTRGICLGAATSTAPAPGPTATPPSTGAVSSVPAPTATEAASASGGQTGLAETTATPTATSP